MSNSSGLLVQADEGVVFPIVDLIEEDLPPPTLKSQIPYESGWSQAPRRQQVLQQLLTDSFRNNQQLVTKRYTKTLRSNLPKRRRLTISSWSLKPTAGHSTESSLSQLQLLICATISAGNTKKLTNTCRFLVNPRTRASAANRFLFKRYY
ncbi:hypothetical protein F511_39843 [Dorcoceras hygrometricum]|uniref:Uncharacterized protein n=1 Tax=Dorcoceras hygrometricum TaxID=472368 RepID=A0A2Z7CYQ0_9LAMI|nr:hypothetical protein F511_39843 [Dorcoceras hygrometricum]